MDPASAAFIFMLNHADVATAAYKNAAAPGAVEVTKMNESLADFARCVLTCYHKTARFHQADVVAAPWSRQNQYAAEKSVVIRINYSGISSSSYQMHVAAMAKGKAVRTAVLADTAIVRYNKNCVLEEWVTGG